MEQSNLNFPNNRAFNSLANSIRVGAIEFWREKKWGIKRSVCDSTEELRVMLDGICRKQVGEDDKEGERTSGVAKGVDKGQVGLNWGKEKVLN